MAGRDIVVIGASAGGVEALIQLVRGLPRELPAAVFVVLHTPRYGKSMLPWILNRFGLLSASRAEDGEPIENGRIYVAPPDRHLQVADGHIVLTWGPRENHVRPAIDVLFRSAAHAYGTRVVGVVLSGTQGDGSMGLLAIKSRGGVAIVQDPADAIYPTMPRQALAKARVDYVRPVAEIGPLLARLVTEKVTAEGERRMPGGVINSNELIQQTVAAQENDERQNELSIYSCPECGGVLWQVNDQGLVQFSCHTGHNWSTESLVAGQAEALEAALWSAIRSLREKATLMRQLASRARGNGDERSAAEYEQQAHYDEQHMEVIRKLLLETEHHPAEEVEVVEENEYGDSDSGE